MRMMAPRRFGSDSSGNPMAAWGRTKPARLPERTMTPQGSAYVVRAATTRTAHGRGTLRNATKRAPPVTDATPTTTEVGRVDALPAARTVPRAATEPHRTAAVWTRLLEAASAARHTRAPKRITRSGAEPAVKPPVRRARRALGFRCKGPSFASASQPKPARHTADKGGPQLQAPLARCKPLFDGTWCHEGRPSFDAAGQCKALPHGRPIGEPDPVLPSHGGAGPVPDYDRSAIGTRHVTTSHDRLALIVREARQRDPPCDAVGSDPVRTRSDAQLGTVCV